MSTLLAANGATLHVDDLGEKQNPVLLYLHGGPGSGAYDFVLHQGERLSRHLRVIAIDQRGVLRSQALRDGEPLGLMDLVHDCEAVRQQLGIDTWSILGHSFGGYVGLLYAHTVPSSIERIIFENPTFDLGLSSKSLLRGAAMEYASLGNTEAMARCLEAAFCAMQTKEVWKVFSHLTNDLKDRRNHLYVHGPNKNFFEELVEASSIPEECWGRGGGHQARLYDEGQVFESLLPIVGSIPHATMVLKGRFDSVFGDDQISALLSAKPDTRVAMFDHSSHFPRFEEPEKYADEVVAFIQQR